jgi:hypothetical protein
MRREVGRAKTSQEYSFGTIVTSILYIFQISEDLEWMLGFNGNTVVRSLVFLQSSEVCSMSVFHEHSSYPGARRFNRLRLVALLVFVGCTVRAQQSCSVTLPTRIPTSANIFSAQQERMLGDIGPELVEGNYHAAHDEELVAHLNAVAEVVLSHSHNRVLVHFIVIDTLEAESFTVAPERIYIPRKMVALLRNDDKLARLLGHELFREILGVNVVSDRKDMSDKLICMFNGIDRDAKLSRKAAQIIDLQEGIQNQADCVALYVSAAAGYSPQAYAEPFDRSAGTNGSRSSILTDFFGTTNSSLRSLREIKQALKRLPRPCQEMVPVASPEFRRWRAAPYRATISPMMGTSRDEG